MHGWSRGDFAIDCFVFSLFACRQEGEAKEEGMAWEISVSSGGIFFEKFLVGKLSFDQHLMDPCVCVFLLREPSSRGYELHHDVLLFSEDVGFQGSLCGILGVHGDDQ